jgi:hypothetical protein
MSTTPVSRPAAPSRDAWKDEAKRPEFIKEIEANIGRLQSCPALLQNQHDAAAFIEIFKKDIAALRLVSTEHKIPKKASVWGECDRAEHRLEAIAAQISVAATVLSTPAPSTPRAVPAPSPAHSSQPSPKPSSEADDRPAPASKPPSASRPGGLFGGLWELFSQGSRHLPIILGGLGALVTGIGTFRQWAAQHQKGAANDEPRPAPVLPVAPQQASAPEPAAPAADPLESHAEGQSTQLSTPQPLVQAEPAGTPEPAETSPMASAVACLRTSEVLDPDLLSQAPTERTEAETPAQTHEELFEATRRMSNDELREYAKRNPQNVVLQRWAELWENYAAADVSELPNLGDEMVHPQTSKKQIEEFFLGGVWKNRRFSEAERARALTLLGLNYRRDRIYEQQLIQALELYNQHLEELGSDTDREAVRLLLARALTSRIHRVPIAASILRLVGIHSIARSGKR